MLKISINRFIERSAMKNYLLEVGTENLPVGFQVSAETQLKETVAERLKEERLNFDNIQTYSTPRRLALLINNLSDKQTDETSFAKGPPANVAFKDGSPTKAAEGFAKRCNISVDKLKIEKFGDTEYAVATIEQKGKLAEEILRDVLPDLILNLKGSHFMRWEDLDVRFSRPIRWVVSIMDNNDMPITIAEVESARSSRGHRFYHPGEVKVPSTREYKDSLREAYVIVDPVERKEKILKQINDIAQSKNGIVLSNDNLINLVNNLVEWPVAALGEFDKEYLKIPKEVITTVMEQHQKYFPIFTADKKALLNNFICVNNKNGENIENIIKGNQRVLKARLEDGAFYYHEDRKHSLASRVEDLKGMTFQKGLGDMHQKTERIKVLSELIADQLGLLPDTKTNIKRTAELCKADLTTFMVREFTELEGIIGRVYALDDKENPEVAAGIGEHYLPRSAEDNIPETITGRVVSLADKIDTILSVFSIGKSPTGSADPLGLRRAALGTIITLLKSNTTLNISILLEKDYDLLGNIKRNKKEEVIPHVQEFITQRLRIYLNEQKYRYDAIDAVLGSKDPLENILDVVERVKIIDKLVKRNDYTPFHESANRLLRILKSVDQDFNIETSLLVHESEKVFYDALNKIDTDKLSYQELIDKLLELNPVIEKFFDDVLVMDKDENIKKNRLSLVYKADQMYKMLADFSKVVN